jgi:xanthine dehydrogenase YagS FAD-binding subunit
VNPSSLAPALIALGATARIFGANGAREVALEKFFLTPQSEGEREYDLKPNELLTEIMVPGARVRSATYEVRQKEALDWPLAAASVVMQMSGGQVKSARVVLGHVAPVPWPSPAAEQALIGKAITEDVAAAAGNAAVEKASSLGGNKYKIQLARIAVKRAVLAAAKGGGR